MLLAQASPSEELNALLAHPLMLGFATLFAAWLASRIVHEQVRQMGLETPASDPGTSEGFGWTALFSALTFWGVLALGLLGITSHLGLDVVGKFLQAAFDLILRGVLAGGILAASSKFADAIALPDGKPPATPKDVARARRERTTILLAGGALAVGAATGLSPGTWIMVALFGIPVVLLLRNADYRKKAAAAFTNLGAGMRLRELYHTGGLITHGERTVHLVAKVGLLSSWIEENDRKVLVSNAELLALTKAPRVGAAEADEALDEVDEPSPDGA